MLPAISQRLLVAQTAQADPNQPSAAGYDGLSGVTIQNAGCVAVTVEKLGLYTSTHFVNWAAGVLAGEVTIEVADEPSYTGPWTPIPGGVVTFVGSAPKQDMVKIDGAYPAFRHRITQGVVGGSVSTKIVGTT